MKKWNLFTKVCLCVLCACLVPTLSFAMASESDYFTEIKSYLQDVTGTTADTDSEKTGYESAIENMTLQSEAEDSDITEAPVTDSLTALSTNTVNANKYYYKQLTTAEARAIYNTLATMLERGLFLDGEYTVDLVEENVLNNQEYDKDELMANFVSARDAFMLDHNVFYLDFDKLSLTQIQVGTNSYKITMGIGRDTTYFYDGFTADNVQNAVAAFDSAVAGIAQSAGKKETLKEQVKEVFDQVMARVSYALEKDAKPENVLYVRTPYGALVKGEAVCEGYARAVKAVLDEMGIENVLVQGVYVEDSYMGPHMWNYVRMEDSRWYLLDATMGDGITAGSSTASGTEYFLKHSQDPVVQYYQQDGVVSLSMYSFEFAYPDLAVIPYEELSDAFKIENTDYYDNISYHGTMGIKEAEAEGKYVIASLNGRTWYYYYKYAQYILWNMGYGNGNPPQSIDAAAMGCDAKGYFPNMFNLAYFAVTDIAPAVEEFDQSNALAYFTYYEGYDHMYDQTKVGEVEELKKTPPVVVTRKPTDSRLKGGMTYDVELIFSESLRKANEFAAEGLELVQSVEGASFSDFKWDGDRTVTFKLKTAVNYANVTYYYFSLVNLVGKESNVAPNVFSLTTVNNPVFACPKVQGSISQIYASTPALIADSNLAENDWLDENGNSISENIPTRLALVASEIAGEEADDLLEKVEGELPVNNKVLASQTFDFSLNLCSNQVAYISGKKVKVFVPFPEGYNAESNVTFKAYHFNKDTGEVEEIDCVTTDKGIIMMCDSFSPYAVIATEKMVTEKTVMTATIGSGSIDKEILKLSEGNKGNVTLTAEEGFQIDSITLNGKALPITNRKAETVELAYADLSEDGNILEVSFVSADLHDGSLKMEIFGGAQAAGAVITAPEDGWKEGNNTFTVACEKTCVAAVSYDLGATYTRLTAVPVNGAYAFTVNNMKANTMIVVSQVGDLNGDGAADATDVRNLKDACLMKSELDTLQTFLADYNHDGKITNADMTILRAIQANKMKAGWNAE